MKIWMKGSGLIAGVILTLVALAGCSGSAGKTADSVLAGITSQSGTATVTVSGSAAAKATSLALPRDNAAVTGSACTMDDKPFGPSGRVLGVGSVLAQVNLHISVSCRTVWATLDAVVTTPFTPITLTIYRLPVGAKDCTTVAKMVTSKSTVNAKGVNLLPSVMMGYRPAGGYFKVVATYDQQGNTQSVALCGLAP